MTSLGLGKAPGCHQRPYMMVPGSSGPGIHHSFRTSGLLQPWVLNAQIGRRDHYYISPCMCMPEGCICSHIRNNYMNCNEKCFQYGLQLAFNYRSAFTNLNVL